MEFKEFVDRHIRAFQPLERESSLAYWEASRSGADKDFKRYSDLKLKIEQLYADPEDFEYVRQVRNSIETGNAAHVRMADLLYLRYLGNQIDPVLLARIVELGTQVEGRFGTFRAEHDGEQITTNAVYRLLREEGDCAKRRAVWEAQKLVGRLVADDLLELVGLRNEAARGIGFDNYYAMSLAHTEQSEAEIEAVFAELEELTGEPYLEMKQEMDSQLARRYGIEPADMQPWHYHDPYFQEVPKTSGIDFDRFYEGKDIIELASLFYASIGMPLDDVLERSDLYEREGKNPHAFCTDIDRCGDIRILANVKDDNYWMETILHEMGHAAYDKYIDRSLPYLLRKYPHLCTTEASAMYFGRLAQDPIWLREALGLPDREVDRITPVIQEALRCKQLIFTRWCQTMFHFERALYADPGQDLNTLWWDIVERYQGVKRPDGRNEPDWATKIHIVSSPVYYHNYMLGELIASQFYDYIRHTILTHSTGGGGIYGNRAVGSYFIDVVYKPGDTVPWTEHVELVTGEPLTARHFVEQFVKERD
ncbi:MAG TPA: M2 family metallopeptidase [Patescibacteria group bacterium]|nr:M2 family metallopeptidase [Patescibacteria group bacterium]